MPPALRYCYAPAMVSRISVVAGLVLGVVLAGLLLGGVVVLAPPSVPVASPAVTVAP